MATQQQRLTKLLRTVGAKPHQCRMAAIILFLHGLEAAKMYVHKLQEHGRTTIPLSPAPGETFFVKDRVMGVVEAQRENAEIKVRVRGANTNPKLDEWHTLGEIS